MKTWAERKQRAQRVALEVLPADKRPAFATRGAKERACGGCHACCHVQKIEAVGKPAHADCPHQTPAGCALHGTPAKPEECCGYYCAWALGWLVGEDTKPSTMGLVVDFRMSVRDDGSTVEDPAYDMVAVWEAWPGAVLANMAFLDKVLRLGNHTILVPYGAKPTPDGHRVNHIKLHNLWRMFPPQERERQLRRAIARCLQEDNP